MIRYLSYPAGPDDYVSVDTQRRLAACQHQTCVQIPVTNDDLLEGDETFIVRLSDLIYSGPSIRVSPEQAQVIINDDDDSEFKFEELSITY